MATTALFDTDKLTQWLGFVVTEERAVVVEQVVWGWLRPILAADARPDPVPPELFSWALELGAIAHENPAGLSSKQFGDVAEAYSAERRDEILEAVAESALGSGGATSRLSPRGSFPPARCYPDPAETRWRW